MDTSVLIVCSIHPGELNLFASLLANEQPKMYNLLLGKFGLSSGQQIEKVFINLCEQTNTDILNALDKSKPRLIVWLFPELYYKRFSGERILKTIDRLKSNNYVILATQSYFIVKYFQYADRLGFPSLKPKFCSLFTDEHKQLNIRCSDDYYMLDEDSILNEFKKLYMLDWFG